MEAHENFQKRSWRNRCRIGGVNGEQTLTVPLVKGKNAGVPIREVRISYDEDWVRHHERAIRTAYGRAPYYDFYAEELLAVLHERPVTLWQLNHDLLLCALDLLQWPVRPEPTTAFVPPAAEGYLRPGADATPPLPPYPQVFSDRFGYRSGLSVLDALFCLGPALVSHA